MVTSYLLDSNDRILSVDAAWVAFARDNDAPALAGKVVGQSLWGFIANPAVRELYRMLFRRIRATEREVDLPFRCDSPAVKRFMSLSVAPADGPRGTLSCRSSLLREAPQPKAALSLYAAIAAATLDSWEGATSGHAMTTEGQDYFGRAAGSAPVGEMLSICSWCKRLDVHGWCEIDEAIDRGVALFSEPIRPITHGLCPSCESTVLGEMP